MRDHWTKSDGQGSLLAVCVMWYRAVKRRCWQLTSICSLDIWSLDPSVSMSVRGKVRAVAASLRGTASLLQLLCSHDWEWGKGGEGRKSRHLLLRSSLRLIVLCSDVKISITDSGVFPLLLVIHAPRCNTLHALDDGIIWESENVLSIVCAVRWLSSNVLCSGWRIQNRLLVHLVCSTSCRPEESRGNQMNGVSSNSDLFSLALTWCIISCHREQKVWVTAQLQSSRRHSARLHGALSYALLSYLGNAGHHLI